MTNHNKKPIIVAEAATNHGGSLSVAMEMIDAAKEAGADFVKFQSWQVVTMNMNNPAYEIMKLKELNNDDHLKLIDYAKRKEIGFLTTCFDIGRVNFLASLGLDSIKIASTDVTSISMLKAVRKAFKKVILSTGMSNPQEVANAVEVLKEGDFTLLHCVSLYPTPPEKANLCRIHWLKQFTDNVGYSDHTLGTEASKIAISMGACCIEKHFTLKRDPNNIFSAMSALPADIREICDWAKKYSLYFGSKNGEMNPEEEEARKQFIGRWGNNA